MKIEVLSIFPELFQSFLNTSLINKSISKDLISITIQNIRDFAEAPHYKVDDTPYGGGSGMVMKPEPLVKAIRDSKLKLPNAKTIYLSPAGITFNQSKAKELSNFSELILVCGRYEGIDQRVIDIEIDYEISIGDFVLMGGEIPAMVIIEAVTRLIPNVLHNNNSTNEESFENNLLEYPQYTRPENFEGIKVPDILLGGNHKLICEWRAEQSKIKTKVKRPDLVGKND